MSEMDPYVAEPDPDADPDADTDADRPLAAPNGDSGEADPADRADQQRAVETDEEDYR